MNWQLLAVLLIVTSALGYLTRQTLRTWGRKQAGCGGGCGCAGKQTVSPQANGDATLIPLEQVTLRR